MQGTHQPPQARLAAPAGLHHVAYMTQDSAATVDFYTRVMGMKFVATVSNNEVPSTGDPFPYLHTFFQMGDSSLIAFFESVGLPAPAKSSHPAYDVFNHLALNVSSKAEVDRWIQHVKSCGLEVVGPVEHAVIYSAYFHDPSGVRIEVTTTLDPEFVNQSEQAYADLASWQKAKEAVRRDGGDNRALLDWVNARNGQHKVGRSH